MSDDSSESPTTFKATASNDESLPEQVAAKRATAGHRRAAGERPVGQRATGRRTARRCERRAVPTPTPSSDASSSDPALALVRENLAHGRVQEALATLLRLVEDPALPGQPVRMAFVCRHITACYAVMGLLEDAEEWVCRTHRQAIASQQPQLIAKSEVMQVLAAYCAGQNVYAIRVANQALSQPVRPGEHVVRDALLALLGLCYLRLGQLAKAERCAKASLSLPQRSSHGAILTAFLEGDLLLTGLICRAACFRGHVLVAPEFGMSRTDPLVVARESEAAFGRMLVLAREAPVLERVARAGMARARLAVHDHVADRQLVHDHVQWANAQHLAVERDATRASIGLIELAASRAAPARDWLLPLAREIVASGGRFGEFDVLFGAAKAAQACGDARTALPLLSEFNVRLEARNLCRAAVAPPIIVEDEDELMLPPVPVCSDADRSLVRRIVTLVHDDPVGCARAGRLAQRLGISRRNLEYALRRAIGKTPKLFVTELRLAPIREALAAMDGASREELARLGRARGFGCYRSFCRAFLLVFHIKPSEAVGRAWDPAEPDRAPKRRARSRLRRSRQGAPGEHS